jgi:rhodanese-related sulfurtransferase
MKTTDNPVLQQFHIDGVKHISPADSLQAVMRGEAIILDVREESEWLFESIDLEDVFYHPMSVILDRLVHIPTDKPIIVFCLGGVRSSKVANLLNIQGFKDVANLDGGLRAWKAQGLPLRSNPTVGCGCSAQPVEKEQGESSGGCSGCSSNCC